MTRRHPNSTARRLSRTGGRLLAGAFLGSASAGCGSLSPQTIAAHKIADALPRVLGPAVRYEVRVDGDPFAVTRGRVHRVHVVGRDVQFTPTATMDSLTFDAYDVSFDTKNERLEKIGPVDFTGALGQAHLNAYLAQSRPIPGLRVTLRERDVQAQIPVSAGPLHTTASLFGTLSPSSGGRAIDFTVDRARLGIVPLPAGLVNRAIADVNPVVDLSGVRVPISVQSTDIRGRTLILRGTAQINPEEITTTASR